MNKLLRYGALILTLSLLLGFMLGFPSVVLAFVINPIATVLWAAWRIVASVHQSVYWILLIIVCLTLMIRLLPAGGNSALRTAYRYKHEPPASVKRWQTLLKESTSGDDGSATLRDNLRDLLVSMIAQGEPSSPVNLKEALASARISLPPGVAQYLFPDATRGMPLLEKSRMYLLSRTPNWLRSRIGNAYSPDEATIEELLRWMESYMEIRNDR